jgi:nucleoside-diphosphate-sugar epimerase
MNIVVAGAGGAIGGHLVRALLDQGHFVRAVDIKPRRYWWQFHEDAQNVDLADCSHETIARDAVSGMDQCYDLAENMGGIGFIEANRVACAESVEIGISLLRACDAQGVGRFFFSSSACV